MSQVKLMLGDCLERMKEIPDGSVDAIICDPPYGTTKCSWDSVIPLEPMWEQMKRVIKPNGAIVVTASQPFTTTLIASNMKMFKYCMVWDKNKGTQPALAKIKPMQSHEDIIIFGSGKLTYNPQMEVGTPYVRENKGSNINNHKLGLKPIKQINTGYRYPKTIMRFPRDFSAQSRLHPTQKPVALMEYLIKTYTNEGETVLDFTAGSFTTGVACVNINRKFIGIEMDEGYFDIGVGRIKERIKCLDLRIEPEISMGD